MVVRMSRYAQVVSAFRDAVLRGKAVLSPTVRRVVYEGGHAGTDTLAYLTKVRAHAYRVTDEDVAALRAAGWTDETIYELTIAAAVGEGLRRLDVGLAALRAAQARRPEAKK
jgi:alkylhydroperoxidase family enzyme